MQPPKLPLLNANLRWFLAAMVLANVAGEVAFLLLPVYLSTLGASVAQIGLVFSVAAVVALALQLLGGWLSDSIGRLRTIAIGSLTASLGYVAMVWAPDWRWATLALCLEYVSGALVGPSFASYIAEQSTEDSRGRVFGLSKGIFLVVGVVGPLMGGTLAGRFGLRVTFLVAAVLYVAASGMRVWMARDARFASASPPERLTLVSLRSKLGATARMVLAGGVVTWIFLTDSVKDVSDRLSMELQPLYLTQLGGASMQQVGWLKSIGGIMTMLLTYPAGWLSDKKGERVAISAGLALQSLALLQLIRSRSIQGFAAAALLYGAGTGLLMPSYDALISKVIPERLRGVAYGLFHTSIGFLALPAPWLGAQIWLRFGPAIPFAVTAAASLLAAVLAYYRMVYPGPRKAD